VPDATFEPFARIDLAPLDAILAEYDFRPRNALRILEATQAEYGYLPVGALKHISRVTGAWYAYIYGTASYYRHLRFEPPAIESVPEAGRAHVAIEQSYRSALEASLGYAGQAN
jgi:NADH:ubiquinone oxidoreductase subunit E